MKCPECGAFRNKTWVNEQSEGVHPNVGDVEAVKPKKKGRAKRIPSLIEFPSAPKSSLPQWRQELGERVREVHERRAREAILETNETELEVPDEPRTAPVLELLPQADIPPMNPLVVAALQRIERAHSHSQFSGNAAAATVPACEKQSDPGLEVFPASEVVPQSDLQPDRVHNLAVVPPAVASSEEAPKPTRKPKRLIVGDPNDPALNYLDSVPTTVGVTVRANQTAPVFYRMLSAIVDLLVVGFFCFPAVALVELNELNWQDLRVIAFSASTFVVMGFLYFTFSTALTGRTFGMRLFSMRVVDARTGLIPTGAQAAGRALVYMLSLASAGSISFAYALINREGRTAHDRFSRTAVIRA